MHPPGPHTVGQNNWVSFPESQEFFYLFLLGGNVKLHNIPAFNLFVARASFATQKLSLSIGWLVVEYICVNVINLGVGYCGHMRKMLFRNLS